LLLACAALLLGSAVLLSLWTACGLPAAWRWLGVVAVLGSAFLVVGEGAFVLWYWLCVRAWERAAAQAGCARLYRIAPEEVQVLRQFLAVRARSRLLGSRWAAAASALVRAGIRESQGTAFRVVDWAWNYLDAHPHFVRQNRHVPTKLAPRPR
jgi:hypothetical protein